MSQALIPKRGAGLLAFALSPYVTGPLLWALTRAPDSVKDAVVARIQSLPFSVDIDKTVTVLKYLVGLGVFRRVNGFLNRWAYNGWQLRADKAKWQWNKEVVVVTGGCSGIGYCMVKGFVRKGLKVVIMDVQPQPADLKYADVYYYQCDITDAAAVKATAKEIQDRFGFVSVVVNNAGIGTGKTILDATPEYIQKIFGVNVMAHFYMAHAFLPAMIARNKGHIVTVASTASFVSLPGIADYASTKAGVLSFHEALRAEIKWSYKARGVLASIIHPNWTRTPLIAQHADGIESKQGPLLTPEVVAGRIVDQVISCKSGQVIIPAHLNVVSTLKGWPNWLQEAFRDLLGSQAAKQLVTPVI